MSAKEQTRERCQCCGRRLKSRKQVKRANALQVRLEKLQRLEELEAAEIVRLQMQQELWGDKPPPAPQFKEVPARSNEIKRMGRAAGRFARSIDEMRQQKAEQRKLKHRLYYRNYYHKNKAHIDAMRKKRLAARSNGA